MDHLSSSERERDELFSSPLGSSSRVIRSLKSPVSRKFVGGGGKNVSVDDVQQVCIWRDNFYYLSDHVQHNLYKLFSIYVRYIHIQSPSSLSTSLSLRFSMKRNSPIWSTDITIGKTFKWVYMLDAPICGESATTSSFSLPSILPHLLLFFQQLTLRMLSEMVANG